MTKGQKVAEAVHKLVMKHLYGHGSNIAVAKEELAAAIDESESPAKMSIEKRDLLIGLLTQEYYDCTRETPYSTKLLALIDDLEHRDVYLGERKP